MKESIYNDLSKWQMQRGACVHSFALPLDFTLLDVSSFPNNTRINSTVRVLHRINYYRRRIINNICSVCCLRCFFCPMQCDDVVIIVS